MSKVLFHDFFSPENALTWWLFVTWDDFMLTILGVLFECGTKIKTACENN